MDTTEVTITVSQGQIKQMLSKIIKSEHSKLIASVIVDNLAPTDVGLKQLYNSMLGIEDKCQFKIGQEVYVKWNVLSTWRFDKQEMIDAELIKKDMICATVLEIDMIKNTNINLKYKIIKNGDIVDDTYWVKESYVYNNQVIIDEELPF